MEKDIFTVIENGTLEQLRELLKSGADLHAKDEDGKTVLMYAARYKSLEKVRKLVDAGGDVNDKDDSDCTVLMHAATNKDPEVLKLILEAGADNIHAKDRRWQTALMYAAENESPEAVQLLLERGAEVNTKDRRGQTALMLAAGSDNPYETENPVRAQNLKAVLQLLVDAGAEVNAKDTYDRTALMYAAKREIEYPETVELLIDAGADVHADDDEGDNAHTLAELSGNQRIAAVLEEYDESSVDDSGLRPLGDTSETRSGQEEQDEDGSVKGKKGKDYYLDMLNMMDDDEEDSD